MKCLILAAGYATRLYPLTENFPKPLLKIERKTILDYLIDDIDVSHMIDEYIIISNHKFVSFFEEWKKTKNMKITIVDDLTSTNDARLGAVKDIQFAIDKLSIDDDILVIAGDNVLDFSLTKFINYVLDKNFSCVMRYYEKDLKRLSKSGVLSIDENDRVTNMEEKPCEPKSHWCCPPFYFYKKKDAHLIEQAINEGCKTDAPGSFVAWLCKHKDVYAFEMPGNRYDIGDLESYETVKKTYKGIIR